MMKRIDRRTFDTAPGKTKKFKRMKTILRRIFFPLALFVSMNVLGETRFSTGYQSDYHYNTYYSTNSEQEAEEYLWQTKYQSPFSNDNSDEVFPFSDSSDGMGGLPGDPGTSGGGNMGDTPGDPGKNLPIKDDLYAFVILGLGYGVFVYIRKEKKEAKPKCNSKETQS